MYINTKTNQYPLTERAIMDENPFYSNTVPFIPPEGYAWVFPTPIPEHDTMTHGVREIPPILTDKGKYETQWEVYELTNEEKEKIKELVDKMKLNIVEGKIQQLWESASAYVNKYITGLAIGILTIGVIQNKPKALAVTEWSNSIWTEYYRRKALITDTSVDDFDFSSFGKIPYSIPELQKEIGF